MAAVSGLQARLDEKERQIQAIKIELKQTSDARDDLKRRYKEAADEVNVFKRKYKDAADELNILQSETIRKADDIHLASRWSGLRYEIKNLAYNYFQADGDLKTRKWIPSMRDSADEWIGLSRNYKDYLRSETHRPWLVQAFVWLVLWNKVFSVTADSAPLLWTGNFYHLFSSFRSVIQPRIVGGKEPTDKELREYHSWRSRTAALLDGKVRQEDVQRRERPVSNYLKRALFPLTTLESKEKEQQRTFKDAIAVIVSKATQLDAEFYKQQAIIEPFYPWSDKSLRDFEANPGLCESDYDSHGVDPSKKIYLTVSPGLRKRGNASGEQYDEIIVLAKCRVSQSPPRRSYSRAHSLSRVSTSTST